MVIGTIHLWVRIAIAVGLSMVKLVHLDKQVHGDVD